MLNPTSIKDVKIQIGQLCKAKRKEFNLTRDQLADALQMSRATIQNIESGKNATLDNLLKIANHFHLLETIFGGVESLQNSSSDPLSLY
jgi:transcriptional regulator with XRE-family HTH domain